MFVTGIFLTENPNTHTIGYRFQLSTESLQAEAWFVTGIFPVENPITHTLIIFFGFLQKPAKKICHAEFISASLFDKFRHLDSETSSE